LSHPRNSSPGTRRCGFLEGILETLGQRAANGAANLPKQVSDLVRKRIKQKGQGAEIHISGDADATATIALTASSPDEARLALLDLDVTVEELRGKVLRWDCDAMAWRAEEPIVHPELYR
jgi:hypothetical protein